LSRRTKTQKTTSVDIRKVEKLAGLSRLSLGQHEAERLGGELSSILEYFATLDKVDLSKVAPTQDEAQDGLLREDVVRPSTSEDILEGVPQKKGRYVRAPRVF
jgi:aspartyl/glutamyl-tRNA(Asn/Gln) amidotransferase C subunit